MSLPISALSIRRPMPALVAFAVLVILGLVAFRSLPVTRLPNSRARRRPNSKRR